MFAIEKRADVSEQLSCVYRNRLQQGRLPEGHNELRGPVRLIIVRKDGAAGSKLAEEVVGSFGTGISAPALLLTECFSDGRLTASPSFDMKCWADVWTIWN